MRRQLKKISVVIVVAGAFVGSVYLCGWMSLNAFLQQTFGDRSSVGFYKIDRFGSLTELAQVKINGKEQGPYQTIEEIRVVSSPHAVALGSMQVERVEATGVTIIDYDSSQNAILAKTNELVKLAEHIVDGSLFPTVESIDLDAVVSNSLSVWKNEWSSLLDRYEASITSFQTQANSETFTEHTFENPLRERELIQNQINAIKLIAAQISALEADLRTQQESLASEAKAMERKAQAIVDQHNTDRQAKFHAQHEQFSRDNLAALKDALSGYIVRTSLAPMQVATTVAITSAKLRLPQYSLTSRRGADHWSSFSRTPLCSVQNITYRGATKLPYANVKFDAISHDPVKHSDRSPFVLMIVPENRRGIEFGSRVTGSADADGNANWEGSLIGEGTAISTATLTDPIFTLVAKRDSLSIKGSSTGATREQTIVWQASQVEFYSKFYGSPSAERQPIATLDNVEVEVDVALNPDMVPEVHCDCRTTLFDQLYPAALAVLNEKHTHYDNQTAAPAIAIVQNELATLQSRVVQIQKSLDKAKQGIADTQTLLVNRLMPTNVRTAKPAVGSNSSITR